MVDSLSEGRALNLVPGCYLHETTRNLRPPDDKKHLAFAYRSIPSCQGSKDGSSQYITLQASPSSDGVEFVTLDEFFVADPNVSYEQIIQPSAHNSNQNEQGSQHNDLVSYLSPSEVQHGGCIIQLEPVLPNHLSNNGYVNLPEQLQYEHHHQSIPNDSRDDYDNQNSPNRSSRNMENDVGQSNSSGSLNAHPPVPIQIVRPQQILSHLTGGRKLSRSLSSTHMGSSSPTPSKSSRKRGTRTSSLGSSSDEGSLINLSLSSSEGRGEDYFDDESGKHRRSKQPVPDSNKDEKYWRRRQKNNLAAKRSREARKQKESQTTERAAFLEEQHDLLQKTVDDVRKQNEELRLRLSKYENVDDLQKI